jgi:hypothetical protein
VDVVHALEEGTNRLEDDALLGLATKQGRVMFTQDIGFWVMARGWQQQDRSFGGLIFQDQRGTSIGRTVADLEIVAKATEPSEWANCILHLPL